jgi:hypothetical protein
MIAAHQSDTNAKGDNGEGDRKLRDEIHSAYIDISGPMLNSPEWG